jgi:hypothetical protein
MPRLQDEVLIVTCHVDIQANDFITDGWQKKKKKKKKSVGSIHEASIKIIQRVQRPNTGKTRFIYS